MDALQFEFGAEERNRTSDLLITNQLLYRLSYFGVGRHYRSCRAGLAIGREVFSVHQFQAQLFGQGKHHVFRLAVQFAYVFAGA